MSKQAQSLSTRPARPRVLHLIDPAGPSVGPCALAMLGDLAASSAARRLDLMALIVGGSQDERLASDLGINTRDRIASLGRRPWLGTGHLRRYLAAVGPLDVLHCWSLATLAMTMLAAPHIPRLLTLTSEPIDREQGRWLAALSSRTRTSLTILPASNSIKRAWAHVGIEPAFMHVVRPGLDLARLDTAAREPLRRDWAVDSPATTVVLVLAPSGRCVDAARAAKILVCGLLTGLDIAVVVPSNAAHRTTARTITSGGNHPNRLIFDARLERPWEVLPGGDIALVMGDDTASATPATPESTQDRSAPTRQALAAARSLFGPPTGARPGQVLGVAPMLWAAAAGKPVIAEAGYAVAEVVENGKTALVVKPGDNGAIVERLRDLIHDPHKNWSLRDAARSEAYSFFSCSRFAENTVTVYEQVLGRRPIEIPALPLTGGLAFAGRA